jgi:uncharacterized membrane protein (DUF2068 family)
MLIFIVMLALVQGVLGVLRAFEWFNIGADQFGRGLLILPLVGAVAFARGGLVIVVAMLYILFAVGMLLQKSWARWLGLSVAAISVLLVLNVVIQGESVLRAAFWLIAPIIIAAYLLSRSGRAAVKQVNYRMA